jgi:membrane protease YdiL (CAAX protease family)
MKAGALMSSPRQTAANQSTTLAKPAYRLLPLWGATFLFTWALWFASAVFSKQADGEAGYTTLMALGLFAPGVVGVVLVVFSRSKALRHDFRGKLFDLKRIKFGSLLLMLLVMLGTIGASIALSLLFGQSTDQFSFVEGFSFSIGAVPTLLTLLVAALFEEIAWRGYGFDCFTDRFSYHKATWLFATVWALWHVPLFFIDGSYQQTILAQNPLFAVNFLVSCFPLTFLFTWLCIKNDRSVLVCFIFHFGVNIFQELINMTQVTKCIETAILCIVALLLVLASKRLFGTKKAL